MGLWCGLMLGLHGGCRRLLRLRLLRAYAIGSRRLWGHAGKVAKTPAALGRQAVGQPPEPLQIGGAEGGLRRIRRRGIVCVHGPGARKVKAECGAILPPPAYATGNRESVGYPQNARAGARLGQQQAHGAGQQGQHQRPADRQFDPPAEAGAGPAPTGPRAGRDLGHGEMKPMLPEHYGSIPAADCSDLLQFTYRETFVETTTHLGETRMSRDLNFRWAP